LKICKKDFRDYIFLETIFCKRTIMSLGGSRNCMEELSA
jgi:hypothetical protein